MTWKFFHTSLGSVQVTPMNPSHLTHVLLKWHWVVLPSLGQLSCPSEYYLGLYFYSPGSCYRIKVSPSIWNLLDSRDLVQVDGPLDSLVATCWVIKDEEELRDMQERDSGISLFKLLNSALEFVEKTTTFPSLVLFICLRSEQNICCIAAVGALLEYWQSQVHELSEELRDGALGHSCLHWVLALTLSLVPKHSSSSHGGGGGGEFNFAPSPDTLSSQIIFVFVFPRQVLLPCTCHLYLAATAAWVPLCVVFPPLTLL